MARVSVLTAEPGTGKSVLLSTRRDPSAGPTLLVTGTHEPFIPVRLTFTTPGRAWALDRMRKLKCLVESPGERCWHWLYAEEAAELRVGMVGYEEVSPERQPVILGLLRLPDASRLTVETTSHERAVAVARFLSGHWGDRLRLVRGRVVNRLFAADEGDSAGLRHQLDRDVTVVDPMEAERARDAWVRTLPPGLNVEEQSRRYLAWRRTVRADIPLVEDFPLYPEEETPDFRDLETCLRLRQIRAWDRWNGRPSTLIDVIQRVAAQVAPSRR